MIKKLERNVLYDVEEIEQAFPNLKLIYKVGTGDWASYLYFIDSGNLYLEKSAFGPHDAICYKVSDICDESEAEAWKKKLEADWKKYFPNLKLDD